MNTKPTNMPEPFDVKATHYMTKDSPRWRKVQPHQLEYVDYNRINNYAIYQGQVVFIEFEYFAVAFSNGKIWDCNNKFNSSLKPPVKRKMSHTACRNAVANRNFRKGRIAYITNQINVLIKECQNDGATVKFPPRVEWLKEVLTQVVESAYKRQRELHPTMKEIKAKKKLDKEVKARKEDEKLYKSV